MIMIFIFSLLVAAQPRAAVIELESDYRLVQHEDGWYVEPKDLLSVSPEKPLEPRWKFLDSDYQLVQHEDGCYIEPKDLLSVPPESYLKPRFKFSDLPPDERPTPTPEPVN